MSYNKLEKIINASFEKKEKVGPKSDKKSTNKLKSTHMNMPTNKY